MTPPAAAATARPAPLVPRRRPAPAPRPRRISGPVRAPVRNAPVPAAGGLALGALGALESLSSHRLLDRLIRGRLWIGIIAFALLGIVTLQLGLLKLNSGIGRALEKESKLQRENAALSIENSELTGGSRVESQASALGMQLVPVGRLHFGASHAGSDVPRAAAVLRAPRAPAVPEAPSETGGETGVETTTSAAGEAPTAASNGPSGGASEAPASSQASSGGGEQAPPSSEGGSGEAGAGASTGTGAPAAAEGGGTAAPGG